MRAGGGSSAARRCSSASAPSRRTVTWHGIPEFEIPFKDIISSSRLSSTSTSSGMGGAFIFLLQGWAIHLDLRQSVVSCLLFYGHATCMAHHGHGWAYSQWADWLLRRIHAHTRVQ